MLVNENQRLVDRTAERGLTTTNVGGRLPVWLDYDGDKLLDFVMTQYGGIAKLYHQVPTAPSPKRRARQSSSARIPLRQLFDANDDGTLDFLCPDEDVYPQRIYETTTTAVDEDLRQLPLPNGFFPRVRRSSIP